MYVCMYVCMYVHTYVRIRHKAYDGYCDSRVKPFGETLSSAEVVAALALPRWGGLSAEPTSRDLCCDIGMDHLE